MADNPFGLSFSPLTSNLPQQGQYGQGGGPLQEAIQTLQLRRPTVYGAQAPAPAQLLNSQGGAGIPGLQQLLHALAQASGYQGQDQSQPQDRTMPPADPLGPIQRPPSPRTEFPMPHPPMMPGIVYQPPAPFPGGTAGNAPQRPGIDPALRRA